MEMLSAEKIAALWQVSPRTVRNYCALGKIDGAVRVGRKWLIPKDTQRPERANKKAESNDLLSVLRREKMHGIKGGIYHRVQIKLTYNSNHIEGSRLTEEQTRYIYETKTIATGDSAAHIGDIFETANHFRCIDYVLDRAERPLSEAMLLKLHSILKSGAFAGAFAVGAYKLYPNEVGGRMTALPEEVPVRMKRFLAEYNAKKKHSFEEIVAFHHAFECIHPFQDGNGRVGRLILFKECLKNGIVPFFIDTDHKMFYYRGLAEWECERGYLLETCRAAQDRFKTYLDYFRIPYEKDK